MFLKRLTRGRLLGFLLQRSETSVQGLGAGSNDPTEKENEQSCPERAKESRWEGGCGPRATNNRTPSPRPRSTQPCPGFQRRAGNLAPPLGTCSPRFPDPTFALLCGPHHTPRVSGLFLSGKWMDSNLTLEGGLNEAKALLRLVAGSL